MVIPASLGKVLSRKKKEGENHAVILSGFTDERHEENVDVCYEMLRETGYKEKNITVLDYDGDSRRPYPVHGPATEARFRKEMERLGYKLKKSDFLFVYVTNHGVDVGDGSEIKVRGPNINTEDFERYMAGIKAKEGVLLFDQCYSGDFAKKLGGEELVAIAASDGRSFGNSFPQAFLKAFKDATADMNGDGRVSMDEAFQHALDKCRNTRQGKQNPQMYGGRAEKTYLKK